MKENPISFNAEMVNALLSGRKTQTRRPVKNDNEVCRYGEIGDRLWVREKVVVFYPGDEKHPKWEKVPCEIIAPESMPKCFSRITLEITGIRKQLIHHMSDMDCMQEGFRGPDPLSEFSDYWHSIYGNVLPFQWDGQTVWVIDFKRGD